MDHHLIFFFGRLRAVQRFIHLPRLFLNNRAGHSKSVRLERKKQVKKVMNSDILLVVRCPQYKSIHQRLLHNLSG